MARAIYLDLPDLYVLRHGQTEWNRAGRLHGWRDSALTEQGELQARTQGRILADLGVTGSAAVWVSPLGRTMATARLALPGQDPTSWRQDDRLREIHVGDWTGKQRAEMEAERPELFDPSHPLGWYDHAPGGEGLAKLEERCRALLSELTQPTILITHGITSRMLRALALRLCPVDIEAVSGGQGVVHRISAGRAEVLTEKS